MSSAQPTPAGDSSHGYDQVAETFMRARSRVGADEVRRWARMLPRGAAVLDLGCGCGWPITQVLLDEGLVPFGIDASSRMIAAFRHRFPQVEVECNAAEESLFFRRSFDGVVAWGLLFLLAPDTQREVVRRVSRALVPGGRFLFTAPAAACTWADALTGLESVSLGADAYQHLLVAAGMVVTARERDAGDNHYILATRTG